MAGEIYGWRIFMTSIARVRSSLFDLRPGAVALAIATLTALVALPGDADAAGRHRHAAAGGQLDGVWNVVFATHAGNCSPTYSAPFNVVGRRVSSAGSGKVTGGISRNGAVAVRISVGASVATGNGRLAGSAGAGNWRGIIQGDRCSGIWQATRG
jgi:hypothetical protein